MIEIPSLYHFAVTVLAVWAAIHIWMNGDIFDALNEKLKYSSWKIANGLACPLCLSPWVCWLFLVILELPTKVELKDFWDYAQYTITYGLRLFVFGLGLCGCVYILRALVKKLDL